MRTSRILIFALFVLLTTYTQAAGLTGIESEMYLDRVAWWQADLAGLEYVVDEVIVEFESSRHLASLQTATMEGYEISEVFQYRPVAVYKIVESSTLPEALAELEGLDGVTSVSPNLIRTCAFTPNDTLFPQQKYMLPVDAEDAWDVTTGSATVKVALVDTGMDVEHPEFSGRVDWTENFHDPDIIGANNVFDDSGHGTGVAGIIAARGNNNAGIAGMAWDVRFLAFRACGGPDLQCTIAHEVQAIDAAVAQGADVINLSLGGVGTNSLETTAVQDAYNAGVVLVAASGNGNPGQLFVATGNTTEDYQNLYYPAAFPEVIGVAALDNAHGAITVPENLTRAEFSNFGEDIVSVAAVGTNVLTTVPYRLKTQVPYAIYIKRDYSNLSGTSFACPQVSGVAALLLSRFPSASPADVRNIIETTAFDLGGPDTDGNSIDDFLGHGVLDAGGALGKIGGGSSVFQNQDFLVGITQSAVFPDDVYVLIRCKNGCDGAPAVSYFVQSTAENASVTMETLPAHANTYLGRFTTTGSGGITVQVAGLLNGQPLETLQLVYTLVD